MIKVLAVMCSRHRPLMLRNTILQMVMQTYPVDCSVYINSNLNEPEKTDYSSLLDDIKPAKDCKLLIKYGKSLKYHNNYMAALSLVNIDDYDLFLKIDDDDIYRLSYVNDLAEDYKLNKWDLSGEFSQGIINGAQWRAKQVLKNFGHKEGEQEVGMPPTWALSKKAIKSIITLSGDTPYFEDRYWHEHLKSNKIFKLAVRNSPNKNFHYNIHGSNISTAGFLEKDWVKQRTEAAIEEAANKPTPELTLNSFQAIKMALSLFAKALPFLPKDIYMKLRAKFLS